MNKQTLAKEFKDYETLWDNTGNIIKEDAKLTDKGFGSDAILSEWVDAKGNKTTLSNNTNTSTKSSGSYKKRFENLINYHLDHVSRNWDYLVKQEVNDDGFILSEVYNTGKPFLMTVTVSVDSSNTFHLRVETEGKKDYYRKHSCYEDLLKDLTYDWSLPTAGTTEYKNLLKEWVDNSGNRINLNNRSISPASKSAVSNSASTASGDVYAWSVYVKGSTTYTKGGWLSAEYFNGQLEGAVFSTPELAEDYAWDHLKELEDEGELYDEDEEVALDADYFTIETIAYPKADMNANVDLIEFIDNGGKKVVLNSNSAAPKAPKATASSTPASAPSAPAAPAVPSAPAAKASQPPVVAKNVMKRKPAKDRFGLLVPNWQPEFIKLGLEIWNTTKKPADEKDSGAGPTILRIYFEMPNGEEWRLEVTNTKYALAKGLGLNVDEDWDYVISTDRNGKEVVIQRGKTKDYNEFLDILLGLGVISNKKKCV